MTPKDALKFVKKHKAVWSTSSSWTSPASGSTSPSRCPRLDEDTFEEGLGFDGSSIRGWQAINASRHARRAGPGDRRHRSVHRKSPTLSLICNILDPITQGRRTRATRATSPARP